MKNIIKVVLLLLIASCIYAVQEKVRGEDDVCNGGDGCQVAIKQKILVSIRGQDGNPGLGENFDWKILLTYPDKFVILDSDQNSIFDREATPGKVVRVIGFDSISLDCNKNGNKICLVKEMKGINPTFKPHPSVNAFDGNDHKCLVFPIIDATDRPLNEECMYLCYVGQMQANIYLERNKYSRMIDRFQLLSTEDVYSAYNGIPRKMASFKLLDADQSLSTTKLVLYPNYLKAYKDPSNFSSETLKLSLRQIQNTKKVQTVESAVSSGEITQSQWTAFKGKYDVPDDDGTANQCCLYIPLKTPLFSNGENFTFFCLYLTEAQVAAKTPCQPITRMWATQVNSMVDRLNILQDYYYLQQNVKTISCAPGDRAPQFAIFIDRAENIQKNEDRICEELRITDSVTDADCRKMKEDDIMLEVQMLARNKDVENMFMECVKDNQIDLRSPYDK